MEVQGNTLFDEQKAADFPKWKYMATQIISDSPSFLFTNAINALKVRNELHSFKKAEL